MKNNHKFIGTNYASFIVYKCDFLSVEKSDKTKMAYGLVLKSMDLVLLCK
jgi:hypothetical protein